MIELLKKALAAGHDANYVLFDTWFSNPAQFIAVKELGLDSIAMVKKSSRIHYEYEEQQLSVKQIFSKNKKRRGRSKYRLPWMSRAEEIIRSRLRLSTCVIKRTKKTGVPLSARTRSCLKKRSSRFMEKMANRGLFQNLQFLPQPHKRVPQSFL